MTPDETAAPAANTDTDVSAHPSIEDLPYDLDLDLLQPQPKRIKVGGSVYTINPPKVRDIVKLYRLAGILENTKLIDAEKPTQDMIDAFQELIPDFVDDGQLTLSQIWLLFGFVTQMVNPNDNSALKALNIEPTAEKKTQPDS